ncbi:uncharacterized protein MYCGRDRAFT_97820 [Zymoseptoria tritici IPO323]|uniref:Uncharacterized protein n=1 Tax=Zymoseptoria tritici (strain CBS 115943 / IPO323) TaxID=336722 RepID=F9XRH0_ZYMTI|nr:uncharacterized protein MYCGRDRAFT_97820 [Zymoseptoria tritici IPO323]EGP82168.1 hypothetical protein MYCGRDRAFT_97820 [Zymoseptoria tritici IPO323]
MLCISPRTHFKSWPCAAVYEMNTTSATFDNKGTAVSDNKKSTTSSSTMADQTSTSSCASTRIQAGSTASSQSHAQAAYCSAAPSRGEITSSHGRSTSGSSTVRGDVTPARDRLASNASAPTLSGDATPSRSRILADANSSPPTVRGITTARIQPKREPSTLSATPLPRRT